MCSRGLQLLYRRGLLKFYVVVAFLVSSICALAPWSVNFQRVLCAIVVVLPPHMPFAYFQWPLIHSRGVLCWVHL